MHALVNGLAPLTVAFALSLALSGAAGAESPAAGPSSAGASPGSADASADVPDVASAPETLRSATGRGWEPAFAITSGMMFQEQSSSITSAEINSFGISPLRDFVDNKKWAVAPYVGLNMELMTPSLGWGGLRLFVDGEILPTFQGSLDLAKEGDPSGIVLPSDLLASPRCEARNPGEQGEFIVVNGETFCTVNFGNQPPDPAPQPPTPFVASCTHAQVLGGQLFPSGTSPVAAPDVVQNVIYNDRRPPGGYGCFNVARVSGTGSAVSAQIDGQVYSAGVGVAIPFGFRGRTLWLKPSFGWVRFEIDIQGVLRTVIKPDQREPFHREVNLVANKDQWFDGIGPGLELEMDVNRWGPLQTSLFIDMQAYKILGSRSVGLSDSDSQRLVLNSPPVTGTCDTLPGKSIRSCNAGFGGAATFNSDFTFEVDPWMYRAGLGLRFRWVGY